MAASIEVRFTPTREEVTSTIRWLTFRRQRASLAILGIIVLLLTVGSAVSSARSGRWTDLLWVLALPAVMTLTVLYMAFVTPARSYRRLPVTFREGEQHWRFSEQGCELRAPTLEAKFLWSSWIAFAETSTCFLLLPQNQLAHAIPKRVFSSPDEINRFRDIAQAHISA